MLSCEYCKIFKNSVSIEHLWWLLLQVLYKKYVPKSFANFSKIYRYRSAFLSSCRPITCKFLKIEGPVQVFCSQFSKISQNKFMENNFERLLLDIKRCCKFVIENTAKALRNKSALEKALTPYELHLTNYLK